jgi:hypothetical protein
MVSQYKNAQPCLFVGGKQISSDFKIFIENTIKFKMVASYRNTHSTLTICGKRSDTKKSWGNTVFISFRLSVCLPICLVCLSVYLYVCLSASLPACLSVYVSARLSINLSFCLSLRQCYK